MLTDILNIESRPTFDDRVIRIETHTYNPYVNTTFDYNDEIRIPIQQQDLYTLPYDSFLYIEGNDESKNDNLAPPALSKTAARFSNNCAAFMFDEIRYEIDGVEIDKCRNVEITSILKNYALLDRGKSKKMENAGWLLENGKSSPLHEFNFCVPLDMLLGFCEDYKRIVINARHELILKHARSDANCFVTDQEQQHQPKITLFKVQWRMPHIVLKDVNKLSLLRTLDSDRYLSMAFRSWDLYEYPLLQSTTKHSWAVKAATQLEKPRYVVFALQNNRKNMLNKDASVFDHCDLTNVKLFLNFEFYPYNDMNLNFEVRKIAILYDMYSRFRKTYYSLETDDVYMTLENFLQHGPFVVIDCSHQNESIKSATVDIRIEFECKENVPNNTTAYCLIIHDRLIKYNPLTNMVRKII
ncbi:uncharacterized protein LOC116844971 [Odontomachus brunneus]|uniref:uncharacterized protein LOC116844971 n=1 Tax=Odontomachus brunneus TaxID=486640 RepID=UPI0013F18FB0|nr:uncharacterized protein LOC116844971 [Odontomachus brunneus]